MVQKHNKYMKVTEPLDQKATLYAFDKKIPGKYHCRLFWDYTDMGLANPSIVYDKIIVSKFSSQRKDNIAKIEKYLKRMVAIELINNFILRKKNIYQRQAVLQNLETESNMSKSTNDAKNVFRERRKTEKVS